MSRGIEEIDRVALILELHDRTADRNTALLFNFEPVGSGVACGCATGFDGTSLLDSTTIHQQFFSQRGLAGIRVRNNGKGAALESTSLRQCLIVRVTLLPCRPTHAPEKE